MPIRIASRSIAAGLLACAVCSAQSAARIDPASPAPSLASPAAAADLPSTIAVPIAWHLAPSARYAVTVQMTHRITYDLSRVYKALAGTKADPVTIQETRTDAVTSAAFAAGGSLSVAESITDVRRYVGDPKNTSSVTRTARWSGSIAADGKRSPSAEPLVDPGEGALAELPAAPITPGKSWSFSRSILIERDIGHGTMTYTDTLRRIDDRDGHRIAIIDVKGAGRADVTPDLKAKGFETTDVTLDGGGEFDLTSGLPGVQHYTSHAEWRTRVLWVRLGMVFDGTYDATPWTSAR